MIKEFVPYNEALELKELGFDEPCLAFYNGKFIQSTEFDFDSYNSKDIGDCPLAPTFSQAFRWFRKTYNLHPHFFLQPDSTYVWCIRWFEGGRQKDANTYEEAELACLRKLIEIVKND